MFLPLEGRQSNKYAASSWGRLGVDAPATYCSFLIYWLETEDAIEDFMALEGTVTRRKEPSIPVYTEPLPTPLTTLIGL